MRFPIDGYTLRKADENDMRFVMGCMRDSILLSVTPAESQNSELWINDILDITLITIEEEMMRSEAFILENEDREDAGMLWMGISRDQFTCEGTGYLLGLFVIEELRGRGLGRALVGAAEEWCREKELPSMTLNVGSENTYAKGFYDHLGFGERSAVMCRRLR